MQRIALTLVATLFLAGCSAMRTRPETPANPLPAEYAHATADQPAVAPPLENWWRSVDDPALTVWIDTALARNADLAAALIRVRRASLESQMAANALWPTLSSSLSTGVSRPLSGPSRSRTESGAANLGVAWEVDLFGRLGALRDAAQFEALATKDDRRGVALSLTASVASLYWQLTYVNERIALARQSLAYAQRTRDLVEAQYHNGAVSGLERHEAAQLVTSQQAALSQLQQSHDELLQTIAVVLDGQGLPTAEPTQFPSRPLPAVQPGLPADLLARRPDLRAAEQRLRATLASGDADRLRYYPALSLTGALGTSSASLLHLLSNPVATLGVGVTLPFLNVREMRLSTDIAGARYEEAVVLFRKSLLTAFTEVEKALSARSHLQAQALLLQQSLEQTRAIELRSEARYRYGQTALRVWLDAQDRRRAAELALASTRFEQHQNHIALVQALGGGLD